MDKKTKKIIWELLRKPNNDVVVALCEGQDHHKFCADRGFTFNEASNAIGKLFDEVKPEE
jgi:hypothetical protein